jgi:hypothetical protein
MNTEAARGKTWNTRQNAEETGAYATPEQMQVRNESCESKQPHLDWDCAYQTGDTCDADEGI